MDVIDKKLISPSPLGSWESPSAPGWSTAGPPGGAGRRAQRWEAAAGTPCPESPWPWPSVLEGSRWTDTPCYSWWAVRKTRERLNKWINASGEMKAVILLVIKQVSDYCGCVFKIGRDINASIRMLNVSNKASWTNSDPCVNAPHFLRRGMMTGRDCGMGFSRAQEPIKNCFFRLTHV